jgi:hypothetical protein
MPRATAGTRFLRPQDSHAITLLFADIVAILARNGARDPATALNAPAPPHRREHGERRSRFHRHDRIGVTVWTHQCPRDGRRCSMTGTPTDDELGPDLDDADLETLRNAFVEAYNARDLDTILELVSTDVELPGIGGDGPDALAEELQAVWERSPIVVLTHARVEEIPAAVAWLPDEHGHWNRVGLMTFDGDGGRLAVVEMPDDAEALQLALAEDPIGDVVDEEYDWSEWERGEPSGDGDGDWHERQLPDLGA